MRTVQVSLLSNAAIAQIAEPGSVEFTRLAMVLALLSGVWLLVLGVLRAGFLINFLSHPVLKGFTSAAGTYGRSHAAAHPWCRSSALQRSGAT